MAQLQKERLKQQNKYNEEDENEENQQKHSEEQNNQGSSVSRLAKSAMTTSMKRYPPPSAVTVTKVKKEISPATLNFTYLQDDEQNQGHHGQSSRLPHFETTTSFEKGNPTTLSKTFDISLWKIYSKTDILLYL